MVNVVGYDASTSSPAVSDSKDRNLLPYCIYSRPFQNSIWCHVFLAPALGG
jgi:hypothetical protein